MNTTTSKGNMALHEWIYLNAIHQLEQVGTVIYDKNMKRQTIERQATSVHLPYTAIAELMGTRDLLEKYKPEINDFNRSLEDYIDKEMSDAHHRRIVYFNCWDFKERFQCISLVQFLPASEDGQSFRMIVYQRSADTEKMKDDWRFFCELSYIFTQRYRVQVGSINVFYGSLHMTYAKGV